MAPRRGEDARALAPDLTEHPRTEVTINGHGKFPSSMADVGAPRNGKWPQNAVYARRYCRRHRTSEYLLGTPNRWMRLNDFDDIDENKLDGMLKAHRTKRSKFNLHLKGHQADCNTTLSKQIYRVIGKINYGGEVIFLIEWKGCWTPEQLIINKDSWVDDLLQLTRRQKAIDR